jgi:hypothetical protein
MAEVQQTTFESGMTKELEGKPCPTLIPTAFIRRLAVHMTKNLAKYGRDNWKKGNSQEELLALRDAAFRHMLAWLDGQDDEDHGAAIAANIFMADNVITNQLKAVDNGG